MPVVSTKYIIAPVLFSTSFLLCMPALAQHLSRTGANQSAKNCLCLKAVKDGASASWVRTQELIESLEDTEAVDMGTCGRSGGVWMNGSNCMFVSDLRGPMGPPGEQGPRGRDGQIDWLRLAGGGGDGSGGAAPDDRGGFGIDVDNDGIGDFATMADARAAGYTNGIPVENCSSCGSRSVGGSGSGAGGGRGFGAALSDFFGGIAAALGGGGGGGGGGSAKVICGELYRQGHITRRVYVADLRYHQLYARTDAIRAYHAWAVPYVRLMQRSKLATWIIRPLGVTWARQMAYEMGAVEQAPRFGKAITRFLTVIHEIIGAAFFSERERLAVPYRNAEWVFTKGALDFLPENFFVTTEVAPA